ncbi:unnamed protein product [Mycena citricolor]|uniref:Uncharacterized protein n=1 Tax=Mycena citricolor TaxID=2018698 RepID=A0AAD2K8J0_9AGAR|nr:unnamed protein product [Mycena citricolor]
MFTLCVRGPISAQGVRNNETGSRESVSATLLTHQSCT